MTGTLDAALRLQLAAQQLTQPTRMPLDRSRPEADPAVADTAQHAEREHKRAMATLHARHGVAVTRGDHAGARQALRALVAREEAFQAAQAARDAAAALVPSLLEQLTEAVAGTGGSNGAAGAGAYRAPIGLAAAELLAHIRRGVHARPAEPLGDRLTTWAAEPWRSSHDADRAERWVADARAIVTPQRTFELAGRCPLCRTRYVWVREDGEHVRKAAIQVSYANRSARCIATGCSGHWNRDYLEHLARVLVQDRDEKAG